MNKRKLLSGNFKTQREAEVDLDEKPTENEFQKEALAKLGGSIAFVRDPRLVEEAE